MSLKKSANGRWRGVFSNSDFVGDADVPATAVASGTPSFFGLRHRARNHPTATKVNAPTAAPTPIPALAPSLKPVVGSVAGAVGLVVADVEDAEVTRVVEEAMVDVVLVAVVVAVLPIVELEVAFVT